MISDDSSYLAALLLTQIDVAPVCKDRKLLPICRGQLERCQLEREILVIQKVNEYRTIGGDRCCRWDQEAFLQIQGTIDESR